VNIFAKVIKVEGFTGHEVSYYTIHLEKQERNEFEDFIFRHITNDKIRVQLNYLNETLERFSKQGARKHYFRVEGAFHALPPPARYLEFNLGKEQLRLYCLFVSEQIIFLFNGGIKTKNIAQDCENVSRYFSESSKFTAVIDTMIVDREITFDQDRSEIINHENIELWLT